MKKEGLRRWEAALLLALSITLCRGVRVQALQTRLGEQVIRLHVVAEDDSPTEQAVKMEVQSAVTAVLEPVLEGCTTAEEARERIAAALPAVESAAVRVSAGRPVELRFGREHFDTRTGEGYTLPAGEYSALRVILGRGGGHNWWGVIFPQLTPTDGQYTDAVRLLGEENVRLVTASEGREIRFRVLEILAELLS